MRFLIDNALSPRVAEEWWPLVMMRCMFATTRFRLPATTGSSTVQRPKTSADTDFGTLMARRRSDRPSVILFRRGTQRRPDEQVGLLRANLPVLVDALASGSVAVIEPNRIRVRSLPLLP